jgi:hypothetical protein
MKLPVSGSTSPMICAPLPMIPKFCDDDIAILCGTNGENFTAYPLNPTVRYDDDGMMRARLSVEIFARSRRA